MEEATVCRICREPIWNFLCIDCLSKNIKKWLPKTYAKEFNKLHKEILQSFRLKNPEGFEQCLTCGLHHESPVCPHCYTHEVYHWLKGYSQTLAKNFSRLFFFYKYEGSEFIKSDILPITESRLEKSGFGMCDSCGEYSDELKEKNKEWICCVCGD